MIELFFDGFCETNPGTLGGFGVVIKNDGKIIKTISKSFNGEKISNNVAEYMGLFTGLTYLLENKLQHEEIRIFGDSMLVIMQTKGFWRIKKGFYKDIALKTQLLKKKFDNLKLEWIPREENTMADELSKPQ